MLLFEETHLFQFSCLRLEAFNNNIIVCLFVLQVFWFGHYPVDSENFAWREDRIIMP